MIAKVNFNFSASAWIVPITVLLTVMLFTGCSNKKTGDISVGESYFWQGMAHYRKGDLSLAEFYWQEAVNVTANSTDATDLVYYAKSASYLSSKYCRYGEFAIALQTSLPALKRLEQLACDTTSDYTNLIIFTGCCKAHGRCTTRTSGRRPQKKPTTMQWPA